jgi:hypothetical protein
MLIKLAAKMIKLEYLSLISLTAFAPANCILIIQVLQSFADLTFAKTSSEKAKITLGYMR